MMRRANTIATVIPDFWIELEIPRKTYTVGDVIDYEVIVHNTDSRPIEFLTITLYQTVLEVVTKRRGMRSKLKKSFNFAQNRIAHRQTAPGYAFGTSWKDSLKIPNLIPASLTASTAGLSDEPVQAAEIQYFLKVHAHQCESFPIKSEDYPILIQSTRRAVSPRNPTSVSSSNLQLGTSTPSSGRVRRAGFESIENTPYFPHRRLGPNDPPRYSALSLPALDYGLSARWVSSETLPPNYDDALLQ